MGVSGQRQCLASLYRGETTPGPIGQEAGWAPEPVWTQRLQEKSFASVWDRTPFDRSTGRPVCSQGTTLTELPQLLLKMGRLITSEVNLTKHQNLSRTGRAGK
jgi:hypothetical protein